LGSPRASTSREYASIADDPGDTFVGAPGAIIDGHYDYDYDYDYDYAFTPFATESTPANAVIEYLTIQHFTESPRRSETPAARSNAVPEPTVTWTSGCAPQTLPYYGSVNLTN
jgi:hypothetical protein